MASDLDAIRVALEARAATLWTAASTASVAVTAMATGASVTLTTATAHGWAAGNLVVLASCTGCDVALNGAHALAAVATNTVTLAVTVTVTATTFGTLRPVPVAWAGRPFVPPENGPWLKVSVLWGPTRLSTMGPAGGALNRVQGTLQIDVFQRAGQGRGLIVGCVDVVRDLFNRVAVSGVQCYAPSAPVFVGGGDPAWEHAAVSVGFDADETV